ncbi:MAG: substrate-binding domain-containing protein [Nocardioides sp.]
MHRDISTGARRRTRLAAAGVAALCLAATGCSVGDDATAGDGGSGEEEIGVALIVKTNSNPFFVAMQEGAQDAAEELGVELTMAAGTTDGDEASQITAIENAISRGDDGILITPNGPGVNSAIEQAREAGLYVIALDTPPDPADVVDITFATDNREAGRLIGSWAAGTLDGEEAVIALLDVFDDRSVSVDYNRDQGFLEGMGIELNDPNVNGDEEPTGTYSGGEGGDYQIVGNEATNGSEDGGRTAMETLLSKNPDINVVYTINEPAAYGAYQALEAAGVEEDVLIVSVDGGCAGVEYVADGTIDATAQQYPLRMAELGVEAIAELVETGEAPETSEGLDFFNTGVALVTDEPVDGVESITSDEAAERCWG